MDWNETDLLYESIRKCKPCGDIINTVLTQEDDLSVVSLRLVLDKELNCQPIKTTI